MVLVVKNLPANAGDRRSPFEKIIWAWIKDNILFPRRLTIKASNLYLKALEGYYAKAEKEAINAQEHTDNT